MKSAKLFGSAAYLTTLCTIATASHAQSSVALYGIIDEGLMYQSNLGGERRVSLDSFSGMNSSRWGIQGREDLGGGMNAFFTLESGINLNTGAFGQGGTAFGRQAYVGLGSARFGNLSFGRQYDMIFYFAEPASFAGMIGSAAFGHPGDLDNTGNDIRVNNAVRYMSPNFYGFMFGGEYSVGGVSGNTTANSGYSLGASYTNGSLLLGTAFEYFKNPVSSTPGSGLFTNNANGASWLAQSLNKGYASASAYQVAIVAASYSIGSVTLAASASNIQYANLGGPLIGGTAQFNNADIGIRYTCKPFLSFSLGYEYLIGKGVRTTGGATVGNQHYNQVAFLTDYLMSKRTDVYFEAGWQRASGTSSLGTAAVADFTNVGDSSNNHQLLVRLDLRHKF
ncbi:porin [Paraburkholderia sediminicola]|uniref:porin n=1 Tax=Paraburkholderia sediminicola TaxID=458836 RepID=UPI0038B772B0